MTKHYTRRQLIRGAAAGAGLGLSVRRAGAASAAVLDLTGTTANAGGDESGLPAIEGARVITDSAQFPTVFNERPEFAAMVSEGTLPPAAERIGRDPLVIAPLHDIGAYGGTIRRGFIGTGDRQNGLRFCGGPDNLLYWDFEHTHVIPNIARDFELTNDFTELVVHLRRGMRWSDGTPFTADDIVFWREDINLNSELSSGSVALRVDGVDATVEKLDDVTVLFRSPAPHPLLPELLAGWSDVGGQAQNGNLAGGPFAPKHYLSQFLPAYTSQTEVDRLAADAGFDSWVAHLYNRNTWELNPDLPVLTPWVVTRPLNDPPWELFANPYSVWVDAEGNQLPYIGEITMNLVEDLEVLVLRSTSGEFDFQDRHLAVASLPVLLENEQRGGYTVHRTPGEVMDFALRPNLAFDADPVLGELIRTVDFRRALSLAIDRDQVNEAFFLGTSTPSATMASADSPYFPGEEWRAKWAVLDIEQANGLLDGIGLAEKDGAGFRLRPDGSGPIRLDYEAGTGFADFTGIGEMIRGQWAVVGIDMRVQQLQGTLQNERIEANQQMLIGHGGGSEDVFLLNEGFLPTSTRGLAGSIGAPYVRWFVSGGTEGTEPPASLRLHDAMDLLAEGLKAPEEERIEIGKEIYKLHADQVWSIGVCGFGMSVYGMFLASNRLKNIPARVLNNAHQKTPVNAMPLTFSY